MNGDGEAVHLPSEIVERVEKRVPRTGFDSPDEYIAFVVDEVLSQVESETGDEEFDTVDEGQVRNRLESLGYLDQ